MSTLKPHPDVVVRKVATELVIVHLGRNEIFTTNPTGARVWALLSDGVHENELVPRLLQEFDAPEEAAIAMEVDSFLRLLRAEGLVIDDGT